MLALALLRPGNAPFDDRIIGIVAIFNVDIYYRLFAYMLGLVGFISLACVVFLARSPLQAKELLPVQFDVGWLLAACAALNGLAWAGGGDVLFLWAALLSLSLYFGWRLRAFAGGADCQERAFLLAVCLAWQGTTTLFMFATWNQDAAFALVFLFALPLSLVMQRCADSYGTPTGVSRAYSAFSLWLFSAPLLYVAVIEISAIGLPGQVAPSHMEVFFLLSLSVFGLGALLRNRHDLLTWCAALSVLTSTVVVAEYIAGIEYITYDLFHLGEKMLPLQQWRDFGALPYLDYMPTHGLADTIPQALYRWLGSGSDLEAMIWGNGNFKGWMMRALSTFLLFLFLGRVIAPAPAFFLIWLLPTYHVFQPFFTLLLLPALHILSLGRYSNVTLWWVIQCMLVALLFFWRLDFGVAALAASVVIAVPMAQRSGRASDLLRSLLAALVVCLLVLLAVLYLSAGSVQFEHINLLRIYMGVQIPGVSYAQFYEGMTYPFFVQYILLPVMTALVFAFSMSALLRNDGDSRSFILDLVQVFMASLALILSLRSLQRHTVFEGDFNTYLHMLVALVFAARHLGRMSGAYKGIYLPVLLMGAYWLLPRADSYFMRAMYHPSVLKQYVFAAPAGELPDWHAARPRYRNMVSIYDDFLAFVDEGLSDGETYYDFANAPLLYALAGVKLPTYIFQTGYQISESLQSHTLNSLAQLHREERLPYVLFAQGIEGWDELDGAHNVLRSYRIAEFIYRHYQPCLRASQLDIWLDRRWLGPGVDEGNCVEAVTARRDFSQDLVERLQTLGASSPQQYVAYGFLPLVWAAEDEVVEEVRRTVSLRVVSEAESTVLTAQQGQSACGEYPCYLDLRVNSDAPEKVIVSFDGRQQFSFMVDAGSIDYRIRLSVLWDWYRQQEIPDIVLKAGGTVSIENAELVVLQ